MLASRRRITDYIATLSGNLEEWESEARYFKEHCNRKVYFESRIEQCIHSVKVPVVTYEVIDTQPEMSLAQRIYLLDS